MARKKKNDPEMENEQISLEEISQAADSEENDKKKVPVKKLSSKDKEKKPKKEKKVKNVLAKKAFVPEKGSATQAALDQMKEDGIDPEEVKDNPLFIVPKKVVDWQASTANIEVSNDDEMRALIHEFYKIFQKERIAVQNQGYALERAEQAKQQSSIDNDDDFPYVDDNEYEEVKEKQKLVGLEKYPGYAYLIDMKREEEEVMKRLIEKYVMTKPVGQWMTSIIGIGPLLSGSLLGYLKPTLYAGQWLSYCGYNSQNDRWLKSAEVDYIMRTFVPANGTIDEEVIAKISSYSGRKASRIYEGAKIFSESVGADIINRRSLEAYLKKPNHNRELNKVCWKVGESMLKIKNKPNSLYGKELTDRILYETEHNENHHYIQEAIIELGWRPKNAPAGWMYRKNPDLTLAQEEELLKQVQQDISDGTFKDFYKISPKASNFELYFNGYLSKDHILQRSKRWVAKLFLSHLHSAVYVDTYGEYPPVPYVFSHGGHCRYIYPEVPLSKIWDWVDDEKMARMAIEASNNSKADRTPRSDNPTTMWIR